MLQILYSIICVKAGVLPPLHSLHGNICPQVMELFDCEQNSFKGVQWSLIITPRDECVQYFWKVQDLTSELSFQPTRDRSGRDGFLHCWSLVHLTVITRPWRLKGLMPHLLQVRASPLYLYFNTVSESNAWYIKVCSSVHAYYMKGRMNMYDYLWF